MYCALELRRRVVLPWAAHTCVDTSARGGGYRHAAGACAAGVTGADTRRWRRYRRRSHCRTVRPVSDDGTGNDAVVVDASSSQSRD